MNCTRVLVIGLRTKSARKPSLIASIKTHDEIEEIKQHFHAIVQIEPCKGQIKARVYAVDEPYYGGTSARLEVEFYCEKCKIPVEGLPSNETELNDFLNKYLEER
jgi:hypothetical protein